VTAALGCAAAAMIPLTHRGIATSVRLVTGHCREGWWLDLDWTSLADPQTTLVFYMGSAHLGEITRHLIEAGLPRATPAAAIAQGTLPTQRLARATLATLEPAVRTAGLASPVLFVIGRVVEVLAEGDAPPLEAALNAIAMPEQVGHA
jgi:uroporphyrin-III C-methyltransferase/precorrin-2 dehydrogenase/sirohydrochlorin ferrochelatase/uroporphyrin-III C-methyltransferase